MEDIPEFTTVESVYVRGRNCLLLQADFSPLFVDYYLHLQKHGLRNEQQEDFTLKLRMGRWPLPRLILSRNHGVPLGQMA